MRIYRGADLDNDRFLFILNNRQRVAIKSWYNETMTNKWNSNFIFSIHKKEQLLNCQKFSNIALLNGTCKVWARIIAKRPQLYADMLIGDY